LLTPLDIHNKEFKRGFRGYSEEEVDDFLDQVVQDFETLLRDNAMLKEQIEDLQQKVEQYRQLESTLHNTLIVAQETAEEVKESARKEAELILREARLQGEKIVHDAEESVRRAQTRLGEARRQAAAFRAQVRSLLESQLEILRAAEDGPEPATEIGPGAV
jgi:cell division initiation protein